MLTEHQNPNTIDIDKLSTLDMLEVINDEDATVAQAVRKTLPAIAQAVDAITKSIQQGGRLIYIGAGTSGRLGILDAVECVPTFSTSPELVQGIIAGGENAIYRAVEGAEDSVQLARDDLTALALTPNDSVVGIAASGRTPYTIGALEYANEIGATTIGVACNVPSKLLDVAGIAIGVPVGAEVITGSTRLKAGTAQKLILNMLSTASMVQLGKVYGNLMVDVKVTNEKLAGRAGRIVAQIANVTEDEANHLLQKADNNVKVAIVIHLCTVSPDEARRMLEQVGGRLREVIDG